MHVLLSMLLLLSTRSYLLGPPIRRTPLLFSTISPVSTSPFSTTSTGGLRRLPVLRPGNELLSTAAKSSYKTVREDKTLKNARARARKFGAERLNLLTQSLCKPLKVSVDGYRKEMRSLHPFEKVVCDLTVKAREKRDGVYLENILDDLNDARKEILLFGKSQCVAIKSAPSAREAAEILEERENSIKQLYMKLAAPPISKLMEMQKSLRTVPAVRLDSPAVVLVGSPNVGKSSIVRAISSGTPEVNNYPFTTRGMTLGHVTKNFGTYTQQTQIMDSPGLLHRPDEQRNEMEALTLASLQHLPTAVMFVMDLSGGAGDACSSIKDQLILRKELRARFPKRPWIDVLAKIDLGVSDEVREEVYEICGGKEAVVELSVHEGVGLELLKGEVDVVLEQIRRVLDVIEAQNNKVDDGVKM